MSVPKLRFKDFNEEWIVKKLGAETTWNSGGTPSKQMESYWGGDIPWISASSMRGFQYFDSDLKITEEGLSNGSKLASKGSLLLLVRGSMLFNKIPVGITSRDVAFNQDVKSVTTKESIKPEFLLYWFLSSENKLLNMVLGTGIGAGKLDTQDLLAMELCIPETEEQTKIASFLTAVDEKITQLTQKCDLLTQYKKGVMQQIFSQELRFKDDDGRDYPAWEVIDLGQIATKVNKKNKDESLKYVLTNSATQGIVSQADYFERDIANQNNLGGYYIVEIDDFVYNPRISVNAPVGPIKRNKLAVGVMSPLYTVFRFKEVILDFFEQFFQTTHWHDYMKSISNYGARHDRMNISNESFFELPLPYPSKVEQTKIANFLTAIDDKINNSQAQLAAVKQYKQGLLQQMFV
jgi:type I restriction enzyme, S subunit